MVEVVLMRPSVLLFHDIQCRQFRQDQLEQARALQIVEAETGMRGQDDLVEFVLDALTTDDTDPVGHTFKGHIGSLLYLEIQLGGKTHTTHHAQMAIALIVKSRRF